jgi:hypothetical protein
MKVFFVLLPFLAGLYGNIYYRFLTPSFVIYISKHHHHHHHEGLNKSDRERVESLYRDGVIGILVLPRNFCWSTPAPAHLVYIYTY